jgi:hypothetical protein
MTTQDVLNELSNAEQVGLQAATNSGDPVIPALSNILLGVIRSMRGCVIAGGGELTTVPTLVPDQLWEDVIAITRWRWIVAIPKLKFLQTDERRQLYTDANTRMNEVANGTIKIELPSSDQVDSSAQSPVNQVERSLTATRKTLAIIPGQRTPIDRLRGLI